MACFRLISPLFSRSALFFLPCQNGPRRVDLTRSPRPSDTDRNLRVETSGWPPIWPTLRASPPWSPSPQSPPFRIVGLPGKGPRQGAASVHPPAPGGRNASVAGTLATTVR